MNNKTKAKELCSLQTFPVDIIIFDPVFLWDIKILLCWHLNPSVLLCAKSCHDSGKQIFTWPQFLECLISSDFFPLCIWSIYSVALCALSSPGILDLYFLFFDHSLLAFQLLYQTTPLLYLPTFSLGFMYYIYVLQWFLPLWHTHTHTHTFFSLVTNLLLFWSLS